MRGMRFVVAGGFMLAGMVAMVQAQFQPGGGGRGGTGPAGLVTNKAVQEDIKASEDQVTKIAEWSKAFRETSDKIRKDEGVDTKGGFGKVDEEMLAKINAANAKITKEAYKQLGEVLKKEQVERVKQIERRRMGLGAFTNAEVVESLKLSDSQKSSVKGISGDFQKEQREMTADLFGKGGMKFDQEKFAEVQKKISKLQSEYMGKVADLLDDGQKKTWKELIGADFDLAKLQPAPPKKKD